MFISYASFQGEDAVGFAVSTLGAVLESSLLDAQAAFALLKETPTLVILDNLETLAEARGVIPARDNTPLRELLDTAAHWSENSPNIRILLTSRLPDLQHPKYPTSGSFKHQHLQLTGLAPQDALDWLNQLLRLPPGRDRGLPSLTRVGLLELLEKVAFHPLSIGLLAKVLQSRSLADVSPRLDELLAQESGEDAGLLASLNLSLDRLEAKARAWLPNLAVFQGGAMESQILKVTGVGKVDEDSTVAQGRQLLAAMESGDMLAIARAVGVPLPENVELPPEIMQQLQALLLSMLADKEQLAAEVNKHQPSELAPGADESTWPALKQSLLHTGLIQTENLAGLQDLPGLGGDTYLRFHPTLAPVLLNKLTPSQAESLRRRHRQAYYQLSGELFWLDQNNPHAARAVVRRELPNLLAAVNAALEAKDNDAVKFANNVNRFLGYFGLRREHERLATRAAHSGGERSSQPWVGARFGLGEQWYNAGRATEAQAVFVDLLDGLGAAPSYQRCVTLGMLGRCLAMQGQLGEAAARYRQKLEELAGLEQDQDVKRGTGLAHIDLGDVLTDLGDYPGARAAYQAALAIMQELGDARSIGAINGQFGTLALRQGQLAEAAQRYQAALGIFRQINEPGSEAVIHHQLGMTYQAAGQWDAAEQACRESARLNESQGNLQGAAESWNQLATVTLLVGKPAEAEDWFRKAIAGLHAAGDTASESKALNNLAVLLLSLGQKDRLAEARQLATQALAIMETLDPVGVEIWKTYAILAEIAEREDKPEEAADWRAKRKAVIESLPEKIRRNLGLA